MQHAQRFSTVLFTVLAVWMLAFTPGTGFAQNSSGSDVVEVRLLPGWRTASGTHMGGIRIRLAPGWKTYWRVPGEAGLPPVLDWGRSQNLADARVRFPIPSVFETNGYRTIGYTDEVVLPIELTPLRRGQPIRIDGKLELGVCQDICMPMTVLLQGEMPVGGKSDPLIRAALANQPRRLAAQPRCRLSAISDGIRLTAELPRLPGISGAPVVMAELPDPRIWVSEAVTRRAGSVTLVEMDFVAPRGTALAFDRSALRLTVLGEGGTGVELMGCAR